MDVHVLIALLVPSIIAVVGWKISGPPTILRIWSKLSDLVWVILPESLDPSTWGANSLERARNAYARYRHLSMDEASSRRRSYTSISGAHKRLAHTLSYPAKLDRLTQVTHANGRITDAIARLAEREFDIDLPPRGGALMDLIRVRESLKHFIRDWSADGMEEREQVFEPILEVLRKVDERGSKRVLIPGAGLGRLAWEISELGFLETTANEVSFFMNLAFRFLLSPAGTSVLNQHVIHPYAHWFSHQRSVDSLFRAIRFPDAIPRLSQRFKLLEKDFLTLQPPPSTLLAPTFVGGYDYIVTLFFIDISLNILTTIEHIYHLLCPGGIWINLGPLSWSAQSKLELSLEEVLRAAEEVGFVLELQEQAQQQSRTVECDYNGDAQAMFRGIYRAEFWVARKPT
ncbi:N2227-like protein-domain-containing protein [Mycena epipterygia]|nr:N2227-like protein-domain-containing protein [Mycena epipterygia]